MGEAVQFLFYYFFDALSSSQEMEVAMRGKGGSCTTRLQKDVLLEEALVLDSV